MTDPEPILLTRREGRSAAGLIQRWQAAGLLDAETADRLRASYAVRAFDWHGLARIAIVTAAACFVIAIASVVIDDARAAAAVLAIAAAALYAWAWHRRSTRPDLPVTNEGVLLLAVLATAGALAALAVALDLPRDDYRHLTLAAAVLYGGLGIAMPSTLVWVFALLSLGGWLGAATGYASGWGAYYLGINAPVRFVLFGLVAITASVAMTRLPRLPRLARPTRVMGLLYLFLALWILSIFGNASDLLIGTAAGPGELLAWSVAFALAAAAAIGHGLRCDDRLTLGFGLAFLGLNLYTKYFEYFWNDLDKAVFFALLGASLWALGAVAQRLWRRETTSAPDASVSGPPG